MLDNPNAGKKASTGRFVVIMFRHVIRKARDFTVKESLKQDNTKGAFLVVLIPAYNEERTISEVINKVPTNIAGIREVRVLVVDDGSSDRTRELALAAGAAVATHRVNRGVGSAYRTGVEKALAMGADIIVNMDADGQFNPADIPALIAPILKGEAGFVTASRFKDPALVPTMSPVRLWGNRMMSRLISGITGWKLYDVSCGFRACSRDVALKLNLSGTFTYTQETFLDLAFKGIEPVEIPLAVRGEREHGKSRVARNLWSYGNRAFSIIMRAYRDYWPWKFFSTLALANFAVAACLWAFLLYWRITRHAFSPHLWSGFAGGFFAMMGMFCLLMGLVGEMLKSIRLNQERMLYYLRKRHFEKLWDEPDGNGKRRGGDE